MKAYKITPSGNDSFTSDFVLADDTWSAAKTFLEESLDAQFSSGTPWNEIKATVECVEITEEEWNEMQEE